MVPELRGQELAIYALDVEIPDRGIGIPFIRPDPCQNIIPDLFEVIPNLMDTIMITRIADMIQKNECSLTFFDRIICFLIPEGKAVTFQNKGWIPEVVDPGKDLIHFKAVKMVAGVIMLNQSVLNRYSFEVIHQG
jgi:hypothetical protein